MRALSLGGSLAVLMTLGAAVVIAGFTILTKAVWRGALHAEVAASCEAVATDVAAAVRETLDFGEPLEGSGKIKPMITRMLHANGSLVFIAVVTSKGIIAFDTDPARIGTAAPSQWRSESAAHTRIRTRTDEVLARASLPGRDDLGTDFVVVSCETGEAEGDLATSLLALTRSAILVLLGSMAVCGVLSLLLTRSIRSWSARMRSRLAIGTPGNVPTGEADIMAGEEKAIRLIQAAEAASQAREDALLRLGMTDERPG